MIVYPKCMDEIVKKGHGYYLNDFKFYTKESISKILHKKNTTIQLIIDYLGIKSYPNKWNKNLYTESDFCQIQEFVKENPNTKVFFTKQTNLKRYGVDSFTKTEKFKNEIKNTCMKKYGVEHYSKTKEYKDKCKKTNLKRFGCEYSLQSEEVRNKGKLTNFEKYGNVVYSKTDDFKEKYKNAMIKNYGVEHYSQTDEFKEKCKKTSLERYGEEHYINVEKIKNTSIKKYGVSSYTKTQEYKDKVNKTNLEKYGTLWTLQNKEIRNKIKETNLKKYGCENPYQAEEIKEKIKKTNLNRYGVEHPSQSDEIHNKMFSHLKSKNDGYLSKAEKKFAEMLTNRNINFKHEYFYNNKHWDFAIFVDNNLNTLVEIDGEYNHGLISDFNGVHVKDQEDYGRFSLIDENIKFIAIDSKKIDESFSLLFETLNIDYEKWINNILNSLPEEFPYHEYSDKRMMNDWKHLCEYEYKVGQKLGYSIINNFHKSIYSCSIKNKPSPLNAWNDKKLLEKCVRNRFIYKSILSSQNIADGFNVCKIAPKISIFNPSLARYLTEKYLNEYDIIFDPFSGFSGRMLGVCSLGKKYIGQDINETTIKESELIKNKFNLDATLKIKDVFDSYGEYDCLFTCSPYSDKENWNNKNQKILFCDEWIDVCLNHFKCKSYLFVVDNTEKYKDYIVEEIDNISHFNYNKEYVVYITI